MEKSRIAALVDGIFAVAMTLLVLDLKLPEGLKMNSDAEVWRQLLELTGRFSTYTLSFIVLGSYWIGHHSLFHFVRKVNRSLLWLNLLFLLFITLLPFSTNLLSAHSHLQIPIVVYGINLLLISLTSLLQLNYLARHPDLSHDQLTPAWIANVRRRNSIPIVIVVASIAISFYNPNFAMTAYWLLLLFHFLPGKHHRPPEVPHQPLDVFQKVRFSNHSAKPDRYAPHIIGAAGNEMWWNGEWNVTIQGQTGGPTQLKGYWASIVVREGDVWKNRMQISNTAPPPAPAQTK